MLGDLDMLQCAQKDAPTMRRLSVELSHNNHNAHSNNISPSNAKDIPGGPGGALRRLSSSSVSSARSSMSSDGAALSPTFSSMSSSMPNAFYLDRVSSLLGRASSLPADRGVPGALPSIPGSAHVAAAASIAAGLPASPARPPMLQVVGSAPAGADSGLGSTRASALIRSLSKGMDSFR